MLALYFSYENRCNDNVCRMRRRPKVDVDAPRIPKKGPDADRLGTQPPKIAKPRAMAMTQRIIKFAETVLVTLAINILGLE